MRRLLAVCLLLAWSSPVYSLDKFTIRVLRRIAAANTVAGLAPFVADAVESTYRNGELTPAALTAQAPRLRGRSWILRGKVTSIVQMQQDGAPLITINLIEGDEPGSHAALLYDFGPKMVKVGMDVDAYGVLVGTANVDTEGKKLMAPVLYSALVCPHYWLQTQLLNASKAHR